MVTDWLCEVANPYMVHGNWRYVSNNRPSKWKCGFSKWYCTKRKYEPSKQKFGTFQAEVWSLQAELLCRLTFRATIEGRLSCLLNCLSLIAPNSSHENSRPINRKKGKATNPNNSFFSEKKKAARVGFEPTTHCLLGRCSNH